MNMLNKIGSQFKIAGEFVNGGPYGSGHINDTYIATYKHNGKSIKYIHQRINGHVFKEPQKVMENVVRVTKHLLIKLEGNGVNDIKRSCLRMIPSLNGVPYFVDEEGKYWRTCYFIENAHTCDIVETADQAFAAGAAFAQFQRLLVDLPGGRLHEIIPDFHNTVKRYRDFENAVEVDRSKRASLCQEEIAFVRYREPIVSILTELMAKGDLPERITHNDTKLNNVMLDDKTNEGLCIIDLDTVMPGTVLYDFGDLVRTSTCPAAEDEKDLSKVYLHVSLFKALAEGYISKAREFLNDVERKHLVFSGRLITFEQGIRFLTDYLKGNNYYKTKYEEHNLDRCRNQFKLVGSIEEKESELNKIIEDIFHN